MCPPPDPTVAARKDHHLDLCLQQEVESGRRTGLGAYSLPYDALPELDLDQVSLATHALGRPLAAPLVIGAMTGGTPRAGRINRLLAKVAADFGLAMALGSQRAMLVDPSSAPSYQVRQHAPTLPLLFANLGAVQLRRGVTPTDAAQLVASVQADALLLHLNPLQEAIQPEGDTTFAGLGERIAAVAQTLPCPVLVKEVGAGIGARTANKLAALPIAGVECAGVGGTSWALVESHRVTHQPARAEIGRSLRGFGVPTAPSILNCRAAFGQRLVIASGGLRSGHDLAVALALGADLVAMARPFLVAAEAGEEALRALVESLLEALRIVLFCTGSADIAALRRHAGLSSYTGAP